MGLLYTPLKIFRHQEKIDSLPRDTGKILPPVHVRIKPTNVCAHSCWYCAYRVDQLQLGKDMDESDSIPRDKMIEIVRDIIAMGVKAVTFSGGGDPFYYRYLLDAVAQLSDSDVRFASLTNGARLEGELAEAFARHATWIRISIDGWDAESYAEYRNVGEKEFGRVIGNMRAFTKLAGNCRLGVSYVIDRRNAAHVFEFTRTLKDIGVASVKMSPCITSNEGRENNRYHEPIFEDVRRRIERAREQLVDDSFEIHDAYHLLAEKFDKDYTWCPNIQVQPVIGADLNVYSCHDKAYNLAEGCLGSIEKRSFREFWFSGKARFFEINPSRDCRHHCVANAANRLVLDYLDADEEHTDFV